MQKLKWLIKIFKNFNGDKEYQKYLNHSKIHHPKQRSLSKKEFFAQKEKEKWSKINRCC
ncbi:MAG: uncharacterized short protein YbdD (DUF466 family) [Rickettsiales bacterium]|jgi:uncharacterized short protein YbdD (DUF466 family)